MSALGRNRLALAVFPTGVLALALLLASAAGPYQLAQNFDPEYCYLLNAANLLTFRTPFHVDHPGTTLQGLGAVVALAKWAADGILHSWQPLDRAVLERPEDYLHAIHLAVVLLLCVSQYLAAREVVRLTGSLAAALALQGSFLLFPNLIHSTSRVSPEPLLAALTYLLAVPVLHAAFAADRGDGAKVERQALMAGALIGAGAVTKITFLPWVLLILAFPAGRARRRCAAAAAGSAFLLALPALPRLPYMARWFPSLLTHANNYGQGPEGLPPLPALLANLKDLFGQEPALVALAAGFAVILLARWHRGKRWDSGAAERVWAVAGLWFLAMAIQMALAVKHWMPHYVVPALVQAGILNAVLVWRARAAGVGANWKAAVVIAAAAVIGAGGVKHAATDLHHRTIRAQRERLESLDLARAAAAAPSCRVAGYYRSSHPDFALHFGNEYSGGVHGRVLEELYPGGLSLNIFNGHFYDWRREVVTEGVLADVARGECVLLQGTPMEAAAMGLPAGASLEPVLVKEREGLYRLRNSPAVGGEGAR